MLTILKIGRLVPELSGLGYLVKYPSPPSSGTNLPISRIYLGQLKKTRQISTRVHQAQYMGNSFFIFYFFLNWRELIRMVSYLLSVFLFGVSFSISIFIRHVMIYFKVVNHELDQ